MLNFQLNSDTARNHSILMLAELSYLERVDLRILDVLQRDGRLSNLKLADAVARTRGRK